MSIAAARSCALERTGESGVKSSGDTGQRQRGRRVENSRIVGATARKRDGGERDRVDEHCPLLFEVGERALHHGIDGCVQPEEAVAGDTDARAPQCVAFEERTIVAQSEAGTHARVRVARVDARENAGGDGDISDGSRHRPDDVEVHVARNDSRATDESHRRLEPHDRGDGGWKPNGRTRIAANRENPQVRRGGGGGTAAGAAREAIEVVRMRTAPPRPLKTPLQQAISSMFAFASTIAPASLSLRATVASCVGVASMSQYEPFDVRS